MLHVLALEQGRSGERSISSFYLGTLRYKRKISNRDMCLKWTSSQNSWSISMSEFTGPVLPADPTMASSFYPSTETIPMKALHDLISTKSAGWSFFLSYQIPPLETYALVSTTLYSTGSLPLASDSSYFGLISGLLYWFPSIGIARDSHISIFLPNWRWCSQTISTSSQI